MPFTPLEQPASNSAGLFVGINEYTDDPELRPLRFAVNDAVALAHLFVVELERIPADNCYLALSGSPNGGTAPGQLVTLQRAGVQVVDAGKVDLLRALIALRRVARGDSDLLVLSISTHGFAEEGIAYVMPADGLRAVLKDTALRLTTIEEQVARSAAGHRLLLIDACQERVGGDQRAVADSGRPDPKNLTADPFAEAIARPTGQAKLASCGIGEYSYEDPRLGHGVFTLAFLEALRGGATADDEKLVRLGAVAAYVQQRVSRWTDARNSTLGTTATPVRQSPSFHGPEAARALPLAAAGDDLTSLAALLERRVSADGPYTPPLHTRLTARLARLDAARAADRRLLAASRDFAAGELSADLFVPFLTAALADREAMPAPTNASGTTAGVPAPSGWIGKRAGDVRTVESIDLELVWCPPGEFSMGSSPDDPIAYREATRTEHQVDVTLTRGFWLGKTEVTQSQWKQVMKTAPWMDNTYSRTSHDDLPVVYVSWFEAKEFCSKLTERERAAGRLPEGWEYRLPTEAQWEYACRAGTQTTYHFGNDPAPLTKFAWFVENCDDLQQVGGKAANPWGLHDMYGNAVEWCLDLYHKEVPGGQDPHVPVPANARGGYYVVRGGAWSNRAEYCRSARRSFGTYGYSWYDTLVGFRLAAVPVE